MTDILTKEQRRKNMQAIKNKDTQIELRLAKAVWNKGYRYRKHDVSVVGKPDLVFKKYKVAVFVDSEFWHGKDWETEKYRIKSNRNFWWNKIENNMQRDIKVNNLLIQKGWKVLRFWGNEVEKNLDFCVQKIEKAINIDNA